MEPALAIHPVAFVLITRTVKVVFAIMEPVLQVALVKMQSVKIMDSVVIVQAVSNLIPANLFVHHALVTNGDVIAMMTVVATFASMECALAVQTVVLVAEIVVVIRVSAQVASVIV